MYQLALNFELVDGVGFIIEYLILYQIETHVSNNGEEENLIKYIYIYIEYLLVDDEQQFNSLILVIHNHHTGLEGFIEQF